MRRRWRIALAAGAVALVALLTPVAYIEGGCRAPLAGVAIEPGYRPLLMPAERRGAAQSFLTYPEWHIVYEAEDFARYLAAGQRPSGFAYGSEIGRFWTSYCAVHRVTRGLPGAADYTLTIYVIGISFSAELLVKAAYERTIGRLFEWASGWRSTDDRHAAAVQAEYGRFLHETPWYRFAFGTALHDEWRTAEPVEHGRHWERRFALSAEYGVKAGYAKLIDAATGATVGRDEPRLRFVARTTPAAVRAIDPRLVPVRGLPRGLTVIEAPRYQQFNDLLARMAAAQVPLIEIAGNDRILATLLLPRAVPPPAGTMFAMPVARPGWHRVGVALSVPDLLPTMARVKASGGLVEHVYDY